MLCKISFRKKHVWVQHVLAWHASVAKQTAGATDRLAAPMATKHHPEAWNAVFNLLGDNVASVVQHPALKTVQHVFYFGGSSKMRSCFFEPDSLGSFRVFCSGKVRLQFFQASSLAKAFTRDASVPFTKDCENFLTARLCGAGLSCSRGNSECRLCAIYDKNTMIIVLDFAKLGPSYPWYHRLM